ncbi:hypothetical protein EK904_011270, partial [Melospiza melodia maxima]
MSRPRSWGRLFFHWVPKLNHRAGGAGTEHRVQPQLWGSVVSGYPSSGPTSSTPAFRPEDELEHLTKKMLYDMENPPSDEYFAIFQRLHTGYKAWEQPLLREVTVQHHQHPAALLWPAAKGATLPLLPRGFDYLEDCHMKPALLDRKVLANVTANVELILVMCSCCHLHELRSCFSFLSRGWNEQNSESEGSGECALQMCTAAALPSPWHPSVRKAAEESHK